MGSQATSQTEMIAISSAPAITLDTLPLLKLFRR
jgi:hypothetical protein